MSETFYYHVLTHIYVDIKWKISQNQLVNCHWLRTELERGVKKISSTPIRDHAQILCAFTGSWKNFPGTTLLHMHVTEKQEERRSCFSGKVSLMLALGGQNCWLQRFFFSAFSWTVAYQSWDCFFCAHTQSTGTAAEKHMELQTWKNFLFFILKQRQGELLMYFLMLSELYLWIFGATPLKWMMLSLLKISVCSVQAMACARLRVRENEKYFGARLSSTPNTIY